MEAKDVVAGYLKLRAKKEEIERKAKVEVEDVKEKMQLLENYILDLLNQTGADNLKFAGVGTAYLSTKDFVSVGDRAAVREYVLESGDVDMLNMAVNKTAVREYMAAHDGLAPPGVQYKSEREVVIRKA